MKKFFSLVIVFVVAVTFFSTAHAMDYQLEQVVVISRHNLRNSLKAGDDRGLLTLRGGEMETLMVNISRRDSDSKVFSRKMRNLQSAKFVSTRIPISGQSQRQNIFRQAHSR